MSQSFNETIDLFLKPWIDKNMKIFGDDFNKANKFMEDFRNAIVKKQFYVLDKLVLDLNITDEELKRYVEELKLIDTSYTKDVVQFIVDDMLVNILSLGVNGDCIKKIDKPISYEECVATSEQIRKSTGHFVFLISSNTSIQGKILGRVRDNKIKIDLMNYYIPKRDDNDPFMLYFGQGTSKAHCEHSLAADFYSYSFEDGTKQYLVLSLEPIKSQRVILHGCVCQVSDRMTVGESFQLPANLNVIFVNKVEEEKRDFTVEEIRELIGTPSFEELKRKVFGIYEHPKWLEELLISWLFCYPVDGYPLHLSILGPPGSGKSASIIDPIHANIPDEHQRGLSTFKGYIPSFGSSSQSGFSEGALLRADRICYLDEFLTPVCAGSNNYNEISNLFGKMTSILEWSAGNISSGKGRNINVVQPTMQLLTCSNFQSGAQDIVQVASRLNNATLSRMFWYVQNQENIDFTKAKVSGIMGIEEEDRLPKQDGKLVALFDFFKMKGHKTVIDFDWIVKVHKKYHVIVPDALAGIYIRYNHHLACIVDGISKMRWLIGEKEDFTVADDEDYKKAEEIYSIVISSWVTDDKDLMSLPKRARVKHIPSNERLVYDYISDYGGATLEELNNKFGDWKEFHDKLLRRELIYNFDGKFYAFWHSVVKEKQLEVAHDGQNNLPQWDREDF